MKLNANDILKGDGADQGRFVLEGAVKWYDPDKGYGVVVPDAGGPDIMVHAACVRAIGRVALPERARVSLVGAASDRGLYAEELLEVSPPVAEAPRAETPARPPDLVGSERSVARLEPARVKWFDKEKGFGFVNLFGRPEDVFIHIETLRRCGFRDLSNGESLAARTTRGPRGLLVAELRPWEAGIMNDEER